MECQADLFADRTRAATMRANQLRHWFAPMAYALMCVLYRICVASTELARSNCGSFRLKLLKMTQITVSVRRVNIAPAPSYSWQRAFILPHMLLRRAVLDSCLR